MSLRSILFCGTTSIALMISSVFAGPYRDAEAAIADAYAAYRMALYQTNQNNQPATEEALASFRTKWRVLSLSWLSEPPPQYTDDPKFRQTMELVASIADQAIEAAKAGELSKSHETLEGVRDALAHMRARNGVVTFSDRMNAYHAQMEHILETTPSTPGALGEDVAVLAFLFRELTTHRPQGVDASVFDQALRAVEISIETLRRAVKSNDPMAIEIARKGLKGPYSRMFLRFG